MKVSDFHYDLPEELIAQHPAARRSDSAMLVLDRRSGAFSRHGFVEFPQYLRSGDCLVINDTRVLCARLWGHRVQTGGRVQAFLLEPAADGTWTCLLRPGRRLPPGARVELEDVAAGGFVVTRKNPDGTFQVRFDAEDVFALMEKDGQIPLPPILTASPCRRIASVIRPCTRRCRGRWRRRPRGCILLLTCLPVWRRAGSGLRV